MKLKKENLHGCDYVPVWKRQSILAEELVKAKSGAMPDPRRLINCHASAEADLHFLFAAVVVILTLWLVL